MSIVLHSTKDQLKVNCHAWLKGNDTLQDYEMDKLLYVEDDETVEEDDEEIVSIMVEYLIHSQPPPQEHSILKQSDYLGTIMKNTTFSMHFQKCLSFLTSRQQFFLNAIATIIIALSTGGDTIKFWNNCGVAKDENDDIPILDGGMTQNGQLSFSTMHVNINTYKHSVLSRLSWWYKKAQLHSQMNRMIFFERNYANDYLHDLLIQSLSLEDSNENYSYSNEMFLDYWTEDEIEEEKGRSIIISEKHANYPIDRLRPDKKKNCKRSSTHAAHRRRRRSRRIIRSHRGKIVIMFCCKRKKRRA